MFMIQVTSSLRGSTPARSVERKGRKCNVTPKLILTWSIVGPFFQAYIQIMNVIQNVVILFVFLFRPTHLQCLRVTQVHWKWTNIELISQYGTHQVGRNCLLCLLCLSVCLDIIMLSSVTLVFHYD